MVVLRFLGRSCTVETSPGCSLMRPAAGPLQESEIPAEWREEFEAAARRPLALRIRYAFIHTYKPVLDDAPYRSWDSTAATNRQKDRESLPRLRSFREWWMRRAK